MDVNLIRGSRLFPHAPYAYASVSHQAGLIFTAGACPLDENGKVTAPGDVGDRRVGPRYVFMRKSVRRPRWNGSATVLTGLFVGRSTREPP
jgi:hypothetical protein